MQAQKFENNEWLDIVRQKLNANADEINRIGDTLVEKVEEANTAAINANAAASEAVTAKNDTISATNEAITVTENAINVTNDSINATNEAINVTTNAINVTNDTITAKDNAINVTNDTIIVKDNAVIATTNANTAKNEANTATTNAITATTNAINAKNDAITATNNANNAKGWTPVAVEIGDGDRIVKKVSDYIGGTGDKPTVNLNMYFKSDGTFTAVLADSTNYGGKVLLDKNTLTGVGEMRVWTGTEVEYNAITVKDNSIIYLVR